MRGLWTVGDTREEAIASVTKDLPASVSIVSCREIDMSGVPPPRSRPLPKLWVVMLQGEGLPEGPTEEEVIEQVRSTWTALSTDPDSLVTGVIEEFDCPACGRKIRLDLPAPRSLPSNRAVDEAEFPECHTRLVRRASTPNEMWQVAGD
jgi:hypothetical protein